MCIKYIRRAQRRRPDDRAAAAASLRFRIYNNFFFLSVSPYSFRSVALCVKWPAEMAKKKMLERPAAADLAFLQIFFKSIVTKKMRRRPLFFHSFNIETASLREKKRRRRNYMADDKYVLWFYYYTHHRVVRSKTQTCCYGISGGQHARCL